MIDLAFIITRLLFLYCYYHFQLFMFLFLNVQDRRRRVCQKLKNVNYQKYWIELAKTAYATAFYEGLTSNRRGGKSTTVTDPNVFILCFPSSYPGNFGKNPRNKMIKIVVLLTLPSAGSIYTVLVLIKLTKFAVALRLRCGSCKNNWHFSSFFAKFKNVVNSLEPSETPSNSTSHQAPNYVQRS